MRFLFVTIQGYESEFYGRVGDRLSADGHDVAHLTYSRRAARLLRERGATAWAVPEVEVTEPGDPAEETRNIEIELGLTSIRDLYVTDPVTGEKTEAENVARAVGHVRRIERVFEMFHPDVVVPEVGNELIRVATQRVAASRSVRTLFLFYTIFPRPLRLYVDTMHAPIIEPHEVLPLSDAERATVDAFRRDYIAAQRVIRPHRTAAVTRRNLDRLALYARARAGDDRDNEYLRPQRWLAEHAAERVRRRAARVLYDDVDPARKFVYFPLHVTDDYKIKRLIPHCADQGLLIDLIADALPPGMDVVIKEHPMSVGRNALQLLRRLKGRANVRLVAPETSTHDLIARAEAVTVISSTVGLEALLYPRSVLTLGEPFYAGFGITVDVDSFADIPAAVADVLQFEPDEERVREFLHAAMHKCWPGAPVMVDDSEANADALARSLADASRRILTGDRVPEPRLET